MLPSVADTISALSGEIVGLLSPGPDPALAPEVVVTAARSHPAGIGGYVGLHADPAAELHARRLDAQVVIRVRAASFADLLVAEARVARELIGADPALLRSRGVLRLQRIVDGADRSLVAADGIGVAAGRELRFSVAFEHMPIPVASEGALDAIPIDLETASFSGRTRRRYASEFRTDPLSDFMVQDGAGVGGAGAWSYDAAAQELRQTSSRSGGSNAVNGDKSGTYLVLRPPIMGGPVRDFALHADVRSDGPGGIGFVFRFVDTGSFGFFLMDEPGGYRILGQRSGGSGALLASGGRDETIGFPQNEWLRLRLLAQGDRFDLAINERPVLSGIEPRLDAAGSVGFFCRRNGAARFRQLRLLSL